MPKMRTEPADASTLGGRLTLHRQKLDLSQTEVGEAIGVRAQSISQWEQNHWKPRYDRLMLLAELFKTSVESLLGNKSIDGALAKTTEMRGAITEASTVPGSRGKRTNNSILNAGSIAIKEIHEDDFNPEATDLREAAELYSWRVPEYTVAHTRNPQDIRIMRVSDDGLAPVILPGDLLFFDAGVRTITASRALYLLAGHATCIRRCEPIVGDDGERLYKLTTDNPHIEPRTVKVADVRVLGRVLQLHRLHVG